MFYELVYSTRLVAGTSTNLEKQRGAWQSVTTTSLRKQFVLVLLTD